MAKTKTNEQIFADIRERGMMTEQEMKLLLRRSNAESKDLLDYSMVEEVGDGEEISDTIYYMIDRSPDQGKTASDVWHISNSCGGGFEIPSHSLLLSFVEQIVRRCPKAEIWVESY